jgi:flagellar biogenesis protein FliO
MRTAGLMILLGISFASNAAGQQPAASSNGVVTLNDSPTGTGGPNASTDLPRGVSASVKPQRALAKGVGERIEEGQEEGTTLPRLAVGQDGSSGPVAARANWWTPLASLGLVLGLIVLGARMVRGYLTASQQGLPSEALRVLGSSQIEPKLTLHVIRWGSRLLLVGSGPQGVRTLAELSNAEEVEQLSALCRTDRPRAMPKTLRQVWNPAQGLGLRRRLTVPGGGRP